MKDQVTTIEQSQRLLALGVPSEKASCGWESWGVYMPNYSSGILEWTTPTLRLHYYGEMNSKLHTVIPAYTVADLLELMPADIPDAGEQNHDYHLTLFNCFCWNLCYENHRTHRRIGERLDFDLVALLCEHIEWLVSYGYKLEV